MKKTCALAFFAFVAGCSSGSPEDSSPDSTEGPVVSHPIPAGPPVEPAAPHAPAQIARTTVDPNALAEIAIDRTAYPLGDSVAVSWAGFPGASTDCVAIADVHGQTVVLGWTEGAERGSYVFAPLPAGEYDARAWCNGRPCAHPRAFVVHP